MVTRNKIQLFIGGVIIIIVLADLFAGKFMLSQGIPAGDSYLNTYQLLREKYDAINGNVESARKLIWFYGDYKNQPQKSIKWEEVAARLGDKNSQYRYGKRLHAAGKENLGIFWLKIASENGDENAIVLLNSISENAY